MTTVLIRVRDGVAEAVASSQACRVIIIDEDEVSDGGIFDRGDSTVDMDASPGLLEAELLDAEVRSQMKQEEG